MKHFLIVACLVVLLGCASTRNTINRLQGDVDYFDKKISRYYLIVKAMEGYGAVSPEDAAKAKEAYLSAKYLLVKIKKAKEAGDKISEKKYMSALVDVLDILKKYDD